MPELHTRRGDFDVEIFQSVELSEESGDLSLLDTITECIVVLSVHILLPKVEVQSFETRQGYRDFFHQIAVRSIACCGPKTIHKVHQHAGTCQGFVRTDTLWHYYVVPRRDTEALENAARPR